MKIHFTIERLEVRLDIGENEMDDIFDRIIAGIAALQAGDTTALTQHVAAIDAHLSNVDGEVLGLQSDDTNGKARLDAIEAGLGKVADAVSPPATSGSSGTPAGGSSGGDGSGTNANPGGGSAPSDGSQTPDNGPEGSGGVPAAGPGSETTGQVDTPVTSG